MFLVYFGLFDLILVVSTSNTDCLERLDFLNELLFVNFSFSHPWLYNRVHADPGKCGILTFKFSRAGKSQNQAYVLFLSLILMFTPLSLWIMLPLTVFRLY